MPFIQFAAVSKPQPITSLWKVILEGCSKYVDWFQSNTMAIDIWNGVIGKPFSKDKILSGSCFMEIPTLVSGGRWLQ